MFSNKFIALCLIAMMFSATSANMLQTAALTKHFSVRKSALHHHRRQHHTEGEFTCNFDTMDSMSPSTDITTNLNTLAGHEVDATLVDTLRFAAAEYVKVGDSAASRRTFLTSTIGAVAGAAYGADVSGGVCSGPIDFSGLSALGDVIARSSDDDLIASPSSTDVNFQAFDTKAEAFLGKLSALFRFKSTFQPGDGCAECADVALTVLFGFFLHWIIQHAQDPQTVLTAPYLAIILGAMFGKWLAPRIREQCCHLCGNCGSKEDPSKKRDPEDDGEDGSSDLQPLLTGKM